MKYLSSREVDKITPETTKKGVESALYVYDELGHQTRSGLDIDGNGVLEPASADRISETDTAYTRLDGAWWRQTTQKVYAAATATTAAIQRQRLTGFSGGLVAQTVSVDIHGNATVSGTTVDQAAQRSIQTIEYPDSTIDAQSVTVGGLLMSSTTKSGVTTTFDYDALGRRTTVTDPRTGTTTTHYDALGQVDWVEDSAGHRTGFAYDPDTGRKTSQTDALGKITRYAHNERGQVTHTWGEVPYPVQYQYDAYGRMSAMTTYRADQGFTADSFPTSAAGDTTTWHYDEATGRLSAKEYADGSQVTYTYTTAGKLRTRTWARQDSGQPLVTTYGYDTATGELRSIDYSDTTPDIAFTYDRLGRQKQITDALGTHTFAYNAALQPESETITGLYNASLTRAYDTTVPGRNAGFDLGDYSVSYGYDTTGRFQSLAWNAAGTSDTATYSYLADSDLLSRLTTASGRQTTYTFEAGRNLKTRVQNSFNSQVISQYDYVHDQIGRRTSVADSGSAYTQAAFNAYTYNGRSELITTGRYLGTDITDPSNPVPAEQRGYLYDPIGNRTEADTAGVLTSYTANTVNQYTGITGQVPGSPTYDPDGNMLTDHKGMRYTYNAENRLVTVQPATPEEGGTRLDFVYDYMGRRVQKLVSTYSSGAFESTREDLFVYNGWNMIKQTSTPAGQSAVDNYYVWGLDLSQSRQGAGGVGGLIARVQGSLTYLYAYDANGNVGQMIDAADGSLAAHYEYDPYGNDIIAVGPMAEANAYRFSTKYFDEETSLCYYGYRYYSPQLGRWTSRDPISEFAARNLYSFNFNDPQNYIDNFGLDSSNGAKIIRETDPLGGNRKFFVTPDGKILGWLIAPTRADIEKFGLDPAFPTEIVVNNEGYVGSLDSLLKKYDEKELTYCGHYSKCIGVAADMATIGAAVATISSGGVALPGTGVVMVTATVVDISNGVATFVLCGPALSHGTTLIAQIPGPPWWKITINAVDAAVTAAGY